MADVNSAVGTLDELLQVMRRLRSEDGCPWDRKQTHHTLKSQLVEECAELLDAIESGCDADIREELGDVLLHVVFHSQIADDEGRFRFSDIAAGLSDKLKRRHPHVFGDVKAEDVDDVIRIWNESKLKEKGGRAAESPFARVPRNLPALSRAGVMLSKASELGFRWESEKAALAKLKEEVAELERAMEDGVAEAVRDEAGDVLMSAAALIVRHGGASPEETLRLAIDKFERRFLKMLSTARATGIDLKECGTESMLSLWSQSKNP